MSKKTKINMGQKYWDEAKKIIPGGTMLFSKNPDLYLPKKWPAYFLKAKNIYIWDLEGKKYIDLATMGVGTNILGYANSEVNQEVIKTIKKSNISTLNSVEEIKLTKILLKINPWAQMIRYTKTGGEANLVALRAARSSSKNYNVAFCGYHGWHDWYLSTNLRNSNNLNTHLLPNVNTVGVPKNFKNQSYGFKFNDIKEFKKIIQKNKLAAVIMEVSRLKETKKIFLKEIRKITKKKNICLIYDECTSGFRETYGGLYKKYGITPDIVVYGKSIANGYPLCAIVGKKNIMKNLEKSFVSSTFWTDRVGYAAAIKTLTIMKREKTWLKLKSKGLIIKDLWKKYAKKYNLDITIQGLDALPTFIFNYDNHLELKTFLTQEFLKKNILTSNTIYLSAYHSNKVLKKYEKILNIVFKKIGEFRKNKIKISSKLESPVCLGGLRSKR